MTGYAAPPIVCGYNTGQHMYVGASDLCNRIVIDMDQDLQYTRLWDIKVEAVKIIKCYSKSFLLTGYSVRRRSTPELHCSSRMSAVAHRSVTIFFC